MPLTDFEVQTKYPDFIPLHDWRDASVAIAISAKDIQIADLIKQQSKYQTTIDTLQDPNKTKEDAIAELAKEEKQREIDELTKQRDEIDAKLIELGKK